MATPIQRCGRCETRKPWTAEFFRPRKLNDGGPPLVKTCRTCEERKNGFQTRADQRPEAMSHFERVTGAMERQYGPMKGWSKARHQEHTERLAAGAGVRYVLDPRVVASGVAVVLPNDYSDPLIQARLDRVRREVASCS